MVFERFKERYVLVLDAEVWSDPPVGAQKSP